MSKCGERIVFVILNTIDNFNATTKLTVSEVFFRLIMLWPALTTFLLFKLKTVERFEGQWGEGQDDDLSLILVLERRICQPVDVGAISHGYLLFLQILLSAFQCPFFCGLQLGRLLLSGCCP